MCCLVRRPEKNRLASTELLIVSKKQLALSRQYSCANNIGRQEIPPSGWLPGRDSYTNVTEMGLLGRNYYFMSIIGRRCAQPNCNGLWIRKPYACFNFIGLMILKLAEGRMTVVLAYKCTLYKKVYIYSTVQKVSHPNCDFAVVLYTSFSTIWMESLFPLQSYVDWVFVFFAEINFTFDKQLNKIFYLNDHFSQRWYFSEV